MRAIALIVVVLLFFTTFACADVILPDTHPVNKCITINNIDSFPDFVIVGKITGPTINPEQGFDLVSITKNECLTKGYKFNQLTVYAIDKNYYFSTTQSALDFNSPNVYESSIAIDPYGGYVSNSDPTTDINMILTIRAISNKKLVLDVASETSNSGTQIIKPIVQPEPEQATPGFIENIISFFKRLFGF